MKRILAISLTGIVFLAIAYAPQSTAGQWTAYLDGNEINDISVSVSYIWCATERGGLVRWNRQNAEYRQYTEFDGMVSNRVFSVAFDENNAVWCGTDFGVQQYNGRNWTTYTVDDGLLSNRVTGIFIDSRNDKWFRYPAQYSLGVTRFDGETWTTYNQLTGLPSSSINDIAEDDSGTIWVATAGGVSTYDGTTWKVYKDELLPFSYSVKGIASGPDSTLWFCNNTSDAYGVAHYDGENWEFFNIMQELGYPGSFFKNYNLVNTIAVGSDGAVWIGTQMGKVMFNGESWIAIDDYIVSPPLARDIEFDSYGILWCADDDGLLKYDGVSWERLIQNPWCVPWGVFPLAADHYGNLWLGMENRLYELLIFDDAEWVPFDFTDTLAGDIFTSISVDNDNIIWISSEGEEEISPGRYETIGKISSFDGDSWTTYTLEQDPPCYILSSAVDQDNVKWFATYGYGVKSFDGNEWVTYTTENSSLPENVIRAVAVDNDNNKWFAPHSNGPVRFDGSSWEQFPSTWNGEFSLYPLIDIAVDRNNVIWFASEENGVMKYDGTTWTNYSIEDGLPSNNITALAVDQNNNLWVGTSWGLCRFDGVAWETINDYRYLEDMSVLDIVVDRDNIVWIATWDGLVRYDALVPFVEADIAAPGEIVLLQNHPNPFNPVTTFEFIIDKPGLTSLDIYNTTGQRIRRIISQELAPGTHSFMWNGRDDSGRLVSSGVYVACVRQGTTLSAKKITLLK